MKTHTFQAIRLCLDENKPLNREQVIKLALQFGKQFKVTREEVEAMLDQPLADVILQVSQESERQRQ